jgi:hypothetical protein
MRRFVCSLAIAALVPSASVLAQGLAGRVLAVDDGVVAVTFSARDGLCGDGRTYVGDLSSSTAFRTYYFDGGISVESIPRNDDLRARCVEGPVRVFITVRDGRITLVRPFVGPVERNPVRPTRDLGRVSAPGAADAFVDLARRSSSEDAARRLVLSATLADSARIAAALSAMARDRSLPGERREIALRWVLDAGERERDATAQQTVRRIAQDGSDILSVRERAIRVLGESQSSDADAFLRGLYTRLDDRTLKERVIRVLGESKTDANTQWVVQVARNESEETELRERAIRVLGEEGGHLRMLREMFPRLREEALRDRVVRMNGENGDGESRRWLRTVIEDANETTSVRERAIRSLAELGDVAYLRASFPRIREGDLRERIIRSVGESGGAEGVRWLRAIALAEREHVDLRDRAIRVLADGGLATAELVRLYDAIDESAIRERLVSILADRGDRDARAKLSSIARNDPSEDIRRRALRKLAER